MSTSTKQEGTVCGGTQIGMAKVDLLLYEKNVQSPKGKEDLE
jgi:hypothetical protein